MVRRRTVTLCLTAAALLAASPLISACGTAHPGAAAVVGGQTISEASLQARVRAVRAAQHQSPQNEQLIDATSDLNRSMLNGMVFDRILDQAARNAGITVDRAEIRRLEETGARRVGGTAELRDALLQQYAVAPGQTDEFYRVRAEAQALARSLGVDLGAPEGQQALSRVLTETARAMRIDISPRYGRWDARALTIGTASEPWLRQAAAPAAPVTTDGGV